MDSCPSSGTYLVDTRSGVSAPTAAISAGGSVAVQSAGYAVEGEVFFASSNDISSHFDDVDDPELVIIDVTKSHVWDALTVATLDSIETKHHPGRTETLTAQRAADLPGSAADRVRHSRSVPSAS